MPTPTGWVPQSLLGGLQGLAGASTGYDPAYLARYGLTPQDDLAAYWAGQSDGTPLAPNQTVLPQEYWPSEDAYNRTAEAMRARGIEPPPRGTLDNYATQQLGQALAQEIEDERNSSFGFGSPGSVAALVMGGAAAGGAFANGGAGYGAAAGDGLTPITTGASYLPGGVPAVDAASAAVWGGSAIPAMAALPSAISNPANIGAFTGTGLVGPNGLPTGPMAESGGGMGTMSGGVPPVGASPGLDTGGFRGFLDRLLSGGLRDSLGSLGSLGGGGLGGGLTVNQSQPWRTPPIMPSPPQSSQAGGPGLQTVLAAGPQGAQQIARPLVQASRPAAPMPTIQNYESGGAQQPPSIAPDNQAQPRRFSQWMQKAAGGFDNAMGRMTPDSPYLAPEENQAARKRSQMAMAAALLQSATPRPKGTGSVVADLGSAMQAGQASQAQALDEAMRMRMIQAQLAQSQQRVGQERAEPAAIREMQALGFPMTPEGFGDYNKARGSDSQIGDQLALIQAQLGIQQRQDQIDRDRKADAEKEAERARSRTQTSNAIKRSITQTADIAGLVEGLEGSFLSAGMPASSFRRTAATTWSGIAGALGGDTSKLDADIGKFDKLKKGLSDQLINLMSTGDLGESTNAKLQQYQNALANTETSPPAIMSIQAGIAESLLEAADAQGVEVADRDKIEANIRKWRAYETPAKEPTIDLPAAARSISEISRMTLDQLSEIDPGQMTPELLEAAKKRWDELNAR